MGAQAIAVRAGRVIAVGSDTELGWPRGPHTRMLDLRGRPVTPGFIDSHVHFGEGSLYLRNVALRDAPTMSAVQRGIADFARAHPNEEWILGEGWSCGYPDLPAGEFHRELIDSVSGGHPVFLDSSMAHAAWANSEALRRAGITRATPDPIGGELVRDAGGEPTGWLKEEGAVNLVLQKIPPPSPADMKAALRLGVREANRLGLTRVDSAGGDFGHLSWLASLEREGELTLRIAISDRVNAPELTAEHLASLETARDRYHDDFLSCCVGKFIMDGVIESHTAYLPGGYADKPAEQGMCFSDPAQYRASVAMPNAHGFQLYTHAIGEGAIHLALDAIAASQATLSGDPALAHPRNRIEHAEAPDREDIARFGSLDVIASMQPLMIYPRDEWQGMEGLWQQYAGEHFLSVAFALRPFIDARAVLAFGTDWPVVQLNPLLGIRYAVLRQSRDGKPPGGYVPEQRISVAEAVRASTLGAAYASRREADEVGIAAGKLADLAVFSTDFIDGPAERIADARVVVTSVGGRIVVPERGASRARGRP